MLDKLQVPERPIYLDNNRARNMVDGLCHFVPDKFYNPTKYH